MVRASLRLLFPLVWLLELLLVVALALLLAAWIWSGTAGSLATLLREAPAYLPAGQKLDAQDVKGSIRKGGQIGLLHWSANGLTVSARDVQLEWQPLDLLRRRLNVSTLKAGELVVDDRRPASPSAPEPPPEILLPLDIDLALAVDTIRLTGATAFEAHGLAARYQYEDQAHQLQITQLAVAQGQYQGTVRLQARLPMALDLQLTGQVQAPVGNGQTMALDASATANGPLAGMAPRLELQVLVQPGAGNSGALAGNRAMRADLSAQVNPWAPQPVIRAQASFNQLDLAALWPTAPRTLLTGNTWVRPAGPHWLAELNLINRDEGPWDKGRLPLASIRGLVEYGDGRLRIESLNAEAAGGRMRLQARLADTRTLSATAGWQGQLQVQGVELSRIYSTLDPVRLDGSVNAVAARDGVDFDAVLQPAAEQARTSPLRGLQLQSASAKGRWAAGWLRVEKLDIRTRDARLDGRLDLQPSTRDARGQIALNAPGLQASVSGDMAARDGKGVLALKLDDASATRRWLARLPMAPAQLDTLDVRGGAQVDLRWRGGWQALATGGGGAGGASIDAGIRIPQLSVGTQGQPADRWLTLSAVDTRLSGALDALSLKASGTVASGSVQAQLQTTAAAGRTARGDWQARVTTLQLQARDSQLPGPWTLSLNQPVALSWTLPSPGTPGNPVLQVAAAQANLSGPAAGTAQLAWQPITWQRGGRTELASKGALRGLPLGWLTLLGDTSLAAAGLTGDLVFDGQWDVTLAETLSVRASLARRSGDLRVQTDSGGNGAQASTIDAGIRVLQLDVQGDGEAVGARFRWDSARAGNAQVDVSTRLARTAEGWQWLPSSPIKGSLRAQMPQVGVWSLLAPPGWRVRGTVDASMDLSGTRNAPQWNGHLDAREMALRSVVDGIEFGNGQLRATLEGQRLRIDSFSLQGAGGKSGGELTATGVATWQAPGNTSASSALASIELQLDAVAKALRVSARADRRLAVSGTLQASVRQSKLQVRGALKVDQALFILPDETAPSLGADVVVLRRESGDKAKAKGPLGGAAAPVPAAARSSDSAVAKERLAGDLLVKLDLGSDFQVRGRGIDTRVAGELEMRSALQPGEAPVVTGQLRTVGGQFKAYGQQLEIERGLLRFTGAYDNPSLDILAIRPKLTQRVGVQVTGNALLPRVRLYADPDLPEAEKLAWLVLGRSAANGGAEAAVLQQAAMALIGGQDSGGGIAGRLGLDELSVSGASDSGSTGGASSATLTLGKRISQNFYVTYERSLAGTLGTFSIFYDLSERLSLRARTGEKSAIDLIFKIRYE